MAALVKAGLAGELSVRFVVHGVELDGAVVGRVGRGAQLDVYVALGRAGQTARYALVEAEVVARLRADGEAARLGQSVRVVVDELVLGAAGGRDHSVCGHFGIGGVYWTLDGQRAVDACAVCSCWVDTGRQI